MMENTESPSEDETATTSVCSSTQLRTHIPMDLFSCLICYETFGINEQQQLVALKCGHMFCAACINQWFATNKMCPTCRKRSVPKDILHIDVSTCIVAYGKKKIDNLSVERDRLNGDIQSLKHSIDAIRQRVHKAEHRLRSKELLLRRLRHIFSRKYRRRVLL